MAIIKIHQDFFENNIFEKFCPIMTRPGNSPLMKDRQLVNKALSQMWVNSNQFKQLLKRSLTPQEYRKFQNKK